ncbi:MAG TPA: hypothetical protein VGO58_02515 [Chitinophagaceae bacterium]|nr:hypothetical protein [Chitinophagaceae bacterium]
MRFNHCFFTGILLLILTTANAQFKKGDRMVGTSVGSIFFNSGGADVSFPSPTRGYSSKTSSYGLRIEPAFGWFISGKTVIGATLNVNPSGQKARYEDLGTTFQEDKVTNFNIGVGGFLRNYFGSNTSSFMPWGQFGFNAGLSSGTSNGFKYFKGAPDYKFSYDAKLSGGFFANATLQVGLTKMMGESAGLDIYLGYNYSYNKNISKTTELTDEAPYDGVPEITETGEPTTKFTNHGLIVGVGFQVFLRGKK